METKTRSRIYPLVMTAVMAAVIAAVAPFALPIGPIPLTLGTLAMYLAGYVLGGKRAGAAVLVYVLLGAVGVPVFNGFTGGLGVVAGPTGGYIIGFIPLAFLSGLWVERFSSSRLLQLVGMILATAVLYAFGTAWFCVQAGKSLAAALSVCVFPFIPGDLAKMVAALIVGPIIRERLIQAGIHPAQ